MKGAERLDLNSQCAEWLGYKDVHIEQSGIGLYPQDLAVVHTDEDGDCVICPDFARNWNAMGLIVARLREAGYETVMRQYEARAVCSIVGGLRTYREETPTLPEAVARAALNVPGVKP